jgi:hypothetical protein
MSINIQTATGLKVLADKTTKETIKAALGYTPADEASLNLPNITDDESGDFYITDEQGNIIFKVDENGAHTTAVNVLDGIYSEKDTFYILGNLVILLVPTRWRFVVVTRGRHSLYRNHIVPIEIHKDGYALDMEPLRHRCQYA